MNRLFEESLVHPDDPLLPSAGWCPLADVYETANAFVIHVELPGLRENEIDLRADGGELTIRGERRVAGPAQPESFHRMERSYGPFSRSFQLPAEIDPNAITARLTDGLLHVELSKAKRPRARRRRARKSA